MEYVNMFKLHLEGEGKSKNTIGSYLNDIAEFYNWYKVKNNCELDKIISLDMQEYKKHINKEYKVSTVNRKIASLNTFFKWMYEKEYMNKPITLKQVKDADAIEFKGLEEKALWQLRKEIHRSGNLMHVCLFEILLNTGIRVSELCDIELSDVTITERKGLLEIRGKGNKKRTLPLNKDTREAILNYLQERHQVNDSHLHIGQRGGIKRNAVDLILKQYGSKIRIEVSAHMLRHTLAYKLIKDNVPITTIQNILGHEKLETTMIYTQTMSKDKEKALENIEW